MATRGYTRKLGLTLDQLRAIDLFLLGQNDTQVAQSLNLHRVTVTRWRLYDPFFKVELNRRRKEYWSGATDAMRAVLPAALETFREQLRISPNRGRLALDVLYRAGLMGTPYSGALGSSDIGPDSLDDLLDEEVLRLRAQLARTSGEDTPPDSSPITEAERKAALDRLLAQANAPLPESEPVSLPEAEPAPVPTASPTAPPSPPAPGKPAPATRRMSAFS